MKVHVARANLMDSVFPHEYCRMEIVHQVAAQARHLSQCLLEYASVPLVGFNNSMPAAVSSASMNRQAAEEDHGFTNTRP